MDAKKERGFLRHLIPYITLWVLLIPLVLLDIFIEIYHRFSFPFYSLKYIKRKDYIKIDRHKLKYLNFGEKLGCVYCGYSIGLLSYSSAIGAATEKYWCGIKHKKRKGFHEPPYHKTFMEYGDEKAYKKLKRLR